MPSLVLTTPEGLEIERNLAGPGSRFGAALLDALLVIVLILLILLSVAIASTIDPTGLSDFVLGVLVGGSLLLLIGYQLVFGLLRNGQTPGKAVFGLRVVSADGWPAAPTQHVLRSLLWPLDVLLPVPMPFGLLGLVAILLTERRQRLGDLVAGTIVVREGAQPTPAEPFPRERWSRAGPRALPLRAGLAARLGEDDFVFLRELLAREGLESGERRRLFVQAARHYSELLELGPFDDARVVLKELYLFLREAREGAAG